MSVVVTLTSAEDAKATRVGTGRHERGRRRGGNDRLKATASTNTAASDILGAKGECAVAKYLGVPWTEADIETPGKRLDVAGYGVRATGYDGKNPDMPIRPGDSGPMAFVQVNGRRCTVHGWYDSAEAMTHEDWKADRGDMGLAAWWVPCTLLHPIQSVPTKKPHQHGWHDPDGAWQCARCGMRYVGPVPVDAAHPDGMQQ